VVIAVLIVALTRSNSIATTSPPRSAAPASEQAATAQGPTAAGSLPTAPRASEHSASSRPDTSEHASVDAKTTGAAAKSNGDVFKISIVTQSPMRVGDSSVMRANIEHLSGKGPLPELTWI
jgi:hypothetical protein